MYIGGDGYDDGYGYTSNYYNTEKCECPAKSKHFTKDKNLHNFYCPMWRDPITGKKAPNENKKDKS